MKTEHIKEAMNPLFLNEVIEEQRRYFVSKRTDLPRSLLTDFKTYDGYATLLTGMRRCGKCTFLLQWLKAKECTNVLYLNFEDIRLAGFGISDFKILETLIVQRGWDVLMFDEIHITQGWKEFIKNCLEYGLKVFISDTDSQISNLPFVKSTELFTFSFEEYTNYIKQTPSLESFTRYMKLGGIPKYVRNEGTSILNNLLDDILVRDIAVRNGIRDVLAFRQLAVYLFMHIGEKISANMLVGRFGLASCATIADYFNLFQRYYLMDFISLYSESKTVRNRNMRKNYAMDVGLINVASYNNISARQRRLENIVYLHLRRKYKDIFYFDDKVIGKCEFIALNPITFSLGRRKKIVAVRYELAEFEYLSTIYHLAKIANSLGEKEVVLITLNQKENINLEGVSVHITPAWEALYVK